MKHLLLVLALALSSAAGAQQQNFDAVQIQTIKTADGVYMLVGQGGNIDVSAGEDGVFVIDDQFAPLTPKILAAIKAISDKPLRFLLNTHWHFDHSGGNENLGRDGVMIVAHDNVYKRLSTAQSIDFFKMKLPPSPKAALPVITFTDTATFHINGDEITALHVARAHRWRHRGVFSQSQYRAHGRHLFLVHVSVYR
jgi:cyclase